MANLALDFDWRSSPSHLDLLSKFAKPRDANHIATWSWWKQTLKEDAIGAIERFLREGAVVDATLSESLTVVLTAAQLKKILKEHGLKQSGTKDELAERLVGANVFDSKRAFERSRVVKCSAWALQLVVEFEQKRQDWLRNAKLQGYDALLRGDPKEAYRLRAQLNRYFPENQIRPGPYQATMLPSLLTSHPKVLDPISSEHLTALRAATGLSILWSDESVLPWLPRDFITHLKSAEVAANLLKANARLRSELQRIEGGQWKVKIQVEFQSGDLDSCDLCMALRGQSFDLKNFPELPMQNCTSDIGCNCYIRPIYDYQSSRGLTGTESDAEGEIDDQENEDQAEDSIRISFQPERNSAATQGPVSKLMQLKEMLNQSLITEEEYQKKKQEILSQL